MIYKIRTIFRSVRNGIFIALDKYGTGAPAGRHMPFLTELAIGWRDDCYKYYAPMELKKDEGETLVPLIRVLRVNPRPNLPRITFHPVLNLRVESKKIRITLQ